MAGGKEILRFFKAKDKLASPQIHPSFFQLDGLCGNIDNMRIN